MLQAANPRRFEQAGTSPCPTRGLFPQSERSLCSDVTVEFGHAPLRHATNRLRTALLRLALAMIMVFIAEPALAKVVVKKGVFGAIALQRETGQFGYAYNAATSRAAKTEALNQCAHPRCEVVASFSNACGALARGPVKYFPATGATRQEAETKALRLCAAKQCEVAAWACTK